MKKKVIVILPALLVLLLLALYFGADGSADIKDAVANGGQISADSGLGTVLADEMGQIAQSFQQIQFMMIAIIILVILYSFVLLGSLLLIVRKRRAQMKKSASVVKRIPTPVYDHAVVNKRPDVRPAIKVVGTYTRRPRNNETVVGSIAAQRNKESEPVKKATAPQVGLSLEGAADQQDGLLAEEAMGLQEAASPQSGLKADEALQDGLTNGEATASQDTSPDEILEFIVSDPVESDPDGEPDPETGNLFAEALQHVTGADIALINSGGIRCPFSCDHITEDDLSQVFPFDDTVTVQGLTEAQIRAVLEYSADMLSEKGGRYLYTSGINVELDTAMPAGERVISVTLANGEPLRSGIEYIVAVNEYIANGGDGYDLLATLPKMSEGQTVVQAVLEYITEIGMERIAV